MTLRRLCEAVDARHLMTVSGAIKRFRARLKQEKLLAKMLLFATEQRNKPHAPAPMVMVTPPRLTPPAKTDGSRESIFALLALFAPWWPDLELGVH